MGNLTQMLGLMVVALCIGAAVQDVRNREIANGFSLAIAFLFLFAVLFGAWPLSAVPSAVGAAAVVFVAGVALFLFGMFGGGDVKLLTVTSLWITPGHFSAYLLAVVLLGGVLAVLFLLRLWMGPKIGRKLGLGRYLFTEDQEKSKTIPYGLAIAAGVLVMWHMDAMGPIVSGGAG